MKTLVSSFALAGLVGACAQPPLPPPIDAPEAPAQWLSPTEGAAPLASGWWRRLGDPVLDGWVERALARNTDLSTAVARVQEARAQERVARAARWPTLDILLDVNRSRSVDAFGRGSSSTAEEPVFE